VASQIHSSIDDKRKGATPENGGPPPIWFHPPRFFAKQPDMDTLSQKNGLYFQPITKFYPARRKWEKIGYIIKINNTV
jgi:hypothetical protein